MGLSTVPPWKGALDGVVQGLRGLGEVMDLYLKIKVNGTGRTLGPIPITEEPAPGDVHPSNGKFWVLKGGRVQGAFAMPSRRVFNAEEITDQGDHP